uniref:Ig-like domain-containing protein n=1 Tax=Oreochromis aureus TaxID=47969 RepID=A0AAZ1XVG4_OREAU
QFLIWAASWLWQKKLLVLMLGISSHASGVEVFVGEESVLLPCQVPANVSRSSTAVVWDRDEFKIPTVHMRLQTGDDLKNQNQRYFRRTIMSDKALQTGDLSLTLRNPTVSDSGNYTCIVRKYGQDEKRTETSDPSEFIKLYFVTFRLLMFVLISEPPPGDLKLSRHLKALLGVVIGLILLSAAVFGFYKYHRYKRKKRGEGK